MTVTIETGGALAAPLAGLKAYLRISGADEDALLTDLIRAASDVAGNLDNPLAPFIYTVSCMHCMSVSLGQGGVGLGAAWGEELALAMLADAGFFRVEVHQLAHDQMNSYFVCRPD